MKMLLLALCFLIGAPLAQAADAEKSAARTIVLVRHGNYVADHSVDEKIGPHLSSLGVAQAYLAGARLRGLATGFDHLYVSPMQRARDTAASIAPEFPQLRFEVIDDLAECTPPTRRADIMAREKPTDLAACKEKLDRDFDRFFKPAAGREQTDLLVCHGNVIRYLTTRALGVDSKAWLEMSVGHASVTTIRVEADGKFKVIAVGDVGHIPPNLRTGATGDADRSLAIPVLQ
ncbi:MAG: histidine phosphatase family protein [Dokdonella sp.]